MYTNEQNFQNKTYWKKKKEWFSIWLSDAKGLVIELTHAHAQRKSAS